MKEAFEVDINADKNITRLITSFETKENYNLDDFITDNTWLILYACVPGTIVVMTAVVVSLVKKITKKNQEE